MADNNDELLFKDDLTGVFNRRYLQTIEDNLLKSFHLNKTPYTIAIVDIDHFKSINDSYGHLKGDEVIKNFAAFLKRNMRTSDIVIRYGGDEFVCILPELVRQDAVFIWERILEKLKRTDIAGLLIGMSVGIATFPEDGATFRDIFAGADAALYDAKRRGRGRVGVLGAKSISIPIPVFVDREKEADIFEGVIKHDSAGTRIIVLSGPVGVGKTRLVREILARIKGREIMWSDCMPFVENIPYFAIRELVKYRLKRLGTEGIEDLDTPYLAEISKLVPEVKDQKLKDSSISEDVDKYRLYESIKLFMDSGKRGKIIVVDNVQWADTGSIEILKYIALSLKNRGLVFIFIQRSEEKSKEVEEFISDVSRIIDATEISLDPFDKTMTKIATSFALGEEILPDTLVEHVFQETGGNPFYIEELLRELFEGGYLLLEGKKWKFKVPERKIVPKSIEDITERKYKELPDEAKNIVEIASVIGYFNTGMLKEFTGFNEGHIFGLLDELIAKGFIREGYERLEFREGISRNTIYNKHVGKLKARMYHKKVADYLIGAMGRKDEGAVVMEIANHLFHAGDLQRAPHYLLKAANFAKSQYAYDIAINYLEKARELYARSGANGVAFELAVLKEFIDINHSMGNNPDALSFVDRAIALAGTDSKELAGLYLRKAMLLYRVSRYDESIALSDKALKIYRELRDIDGEASILNVLGIAYLFKGEYIKSEEYLKKAEKTFRNTEDRSLLASVLNNLGALYDRLGRLKDALITYLESLKIAEDLGDLKGMTLLLHNIGSVYLDMSIYEKAEEYLKKSLNLAEQIGDFSSMANCNLLLGLLYKDSGQFDRALESYRHCASLAELTGDVNMLAWARENSGEIYYLQGKWQDAENLFNGVSRITEKIGNSYLEFYNLLDIGRVYLDTGNFGKVINILDRLRNISENTGSIRLKEDFYMFMSVYLLRTGKTKEAEQYIEKIKEGNEGLKVLRCEILLFNKKYDECRAKLEALDKESITPFYRGLLYRVAAKLYRNLGDDKSAQKYISKARAIFKRLGANKRADELDILF